MSNNKSNDPRDYDENGELHTFTDVREEEIHELQKKVEDLQIKSKKQSEKYEELCYENDEINMKWAEDNERNGDICSELQEQIKTLEEENRMLKDCNIMQYSYLVQGENKLLKEWQDMKNEIGWYAEKVEILEKQLDNKH